MYADGSTSYSASIRRTKKFTKIEIPESTLSSTCAYMLSSMSNLLTNRFDFVKPEEKIEKSAAEASMNKIEKCVNGYLSGFTCKVS